MRSIDISYLAWGLGASVMIPEGQRRAIRLVSLSVGFLQGQSFRQNSVAESSHPGENSYRAELVCLAVRRAQETKRATCLIGDGCSPRHE